MRKASAEGVGVQARRGRLLCGARPGTAVALAYGSVSGAAYQNGDSAAPPKRRARVPGGGGTRVVSWRWGARRIGILGLGASRPGSASSAAVVRACPGTGKDGGSLGVVFPSRRHPVVCRSL
jgi:hypothetical protein